MPLLDFNAPLPVEHLRHHPVTIVGAGAAGIMLASQLAERGQRVLLLESGHFAPDDDRQELNRLEETGKVFGNALWHRKRILGGTTTAWGGQSLPFSPLDFEVRDWVPHSGWALTHADVAPWYPAANAFMQVDAWNYSTDLFDRLHCPAPAFDPAALEYHFSKWAPEPDFFRLRRRTLAAGVTVLYNAHLTRLDRGPDGRIATLTVASFAGRTETLPVETLVIAAGGLESNRILLLNDHQSPGGLGNHSGWLGRAFMEHPAIDAGLVVPDDERAFQRAFATHYHRLRKYSVRLSAAAAWQRRHRLLNASMGFMFSYPDPEHDPFDRMKRLLRRQPSALRGPVLAHGAQVLRGLASVATAGYLLKAGATPRLNLMIEQAPSFDSFVALGGGVDRFGRRQLRVHWKISEQTWDTARAFAHELETGLAAQGLGRVRLDPPFTGGSAAADWPRYFNDLNHHMGGTRLGATPADGVVNPQLQVWHVPNLYVCACSVFPTASHSNPTLTLLALTARLAEHLARAH